LHIAFCSTDLTTYDTAKQAILRNTNFKGQCSDSRLIEVRI